MDRDTSGRPKVLNYWLNLSAGCINIIPNGNFLFAFSVSSLVIKKCEVLQGRKY